MSVVDAGSVLGDEPQVEVKPSDPAGPRKGHVVHDQTEKTESQDGALPRILNLCHCCLKAKCWPNMPGLLLL